MTTERVCRVTAQSSDLKFLALSYAKMLKLLPLHQGRGRIANSAAEPRSPHHSLLAPPGRGYKIAVLDREGQVADFVGEGAGAICGARMGLPHQSDATAPCGRHSACRAFPSSPPCRRRHVRRGPCLLPRGRSARRVRRRRPLPRRRRPGRPCGPPLRP